MTHPSDAVDHALVSEWIDLELTEDGQLDDRDRRRLGAHLNECEQCRAERHRHMKFLAMLQTSDVPVLTGFQERVMESLPATGWEGKSPLAWRLPAAVMLLLITAASALVTLSSADLGRGSSFAGAMASIADLFTTSALAGSGMLWASWRGLGLAIDEVLSGSPGLLIAFIVLVAGLNILLITLMARPKAAASAAGSGSGSRSASGSARSRHQASNSGQDLRDLDTRFDRAEPTEPTEPAERRD